MKARHSKRFQSILQVFTRISAQYLCVCNDVMYICRYVQTVLFMQSPLVIVMHISIADDLKRRFHAACALRGLKMSQVVAELIDQWLKVNEKNLSSELKE
ncbi:hypothetical protein NIES4074_64140 (plasmid) [Cylindrospermum sp. NIES-4074]|nr:hypothetical protein NIES4074_64140 [Cylindrospermum sp. NIES-4074]